MFQASLASIVLAGGAFCFIGGDMTEAERYQAVQQNVKDLLDKAANDKSTGGMVGFGSTWLAAELFARNEQVHSKKLTNDLGDKQQ